VSFGGIVSEEPTVRQLFPKIDFILLAPSEILTFNGR
jgi:hypothetical protein